MKIGDALYEHDDGDYDGNGQPDKTIVWPVEKITERYVYVRDPHYGKDRPAMRLDRAKLEQEGYAYHRRFRNLLYVRPGLDWPMAVISVSAPEPLAIGR